MSKVTELKNHWVIYDDNGIIHSGTEADMKYAFEVMIEPMAYSKQERKSFYVDWKGDLCLSNTTHIYK